MIESAPGLQLAFAVRKIAGDGAEEGLTRDGRGRLRHVFQLSRPGQFRGCQTQEEIAQTNIAAAGRAGRGVRQQVQGQQIRRGGCPCCQARRVLVITSTVMASISTIGGGTLPGSPFFVRTVAERPSKLTR